MPEIVPKEALNYIKQKKLQAGFSYKDVWREEHAKAFTVAKCMSLDLLRNIQEQITKGIAEGKPYEVIAKEMRELMISSGWWGVQEMVDPLTGERKAVQLGSARRIETILDTNMRMAYSAGHYQRGMASKTHEYIMYRIGNSEKHREEHVAWDGVVLKRDDPWWNTHYPPNGYNCRCYTEFLTKRQVARLEKEGIIDEEKSHGDVVVYKKIKRTAPIDIPKQYYNARKGESYLGVKGITPGFEYNPGQAAMANSNKEQVPSSNNMANLVANKTKAFSKSVIGETEPTPESLKTPVSAGITSSRNIKKVIEYSTRIIDSVHGDGQLPGCDANLDNNMNPFGSFNYLTKKLLVKVKTNNHPELTAVHEIGHYIDYFGLYKEPYKIRMTDSIGLPKVKKLIDAIKNSTTIKYGAAFYSFDPGYQDYYLREREMFARAYAQYIAIKSGDAILLSQLRDSQSNLKTNFLQWSDSDFMPIMKAMDNLLEENGWLKKKK